MHVPSSSVAVDRGYSRVGRHPLGGDDYDLSAHLQGQLPQVVEHLINLRVSEVPELDVAGLSIDPAGNLTVGFNKQSRGPPGDDRLGDAHHIFLAEILGLCSAELLDQRGEPFQVVRLDYLPGAPAEFVCGQGVRVDVDAFVHQQWVMACLLYTSPSPRDRTRSRMPSSA